jgi:hypothetical protein
LASGQAAMNYGKDTEYSGAGAATAEPLPLSAAQRDMVREQLGRILASHLFRNSKRFPEFLRYTVNRVLNDDTDHIKERAIGIDIFGRDRDYDTSLDPIVRVTAGEVRKRLAQYYQSPHAAGELRIEFARGSYVPEFNFPEDKPIETHVSDVQITSLAAPRKYGKTTLFAAALAIVCVVLSAFMLGLKRESALDRFWSPVSDAKSPVLLCIPGRSSAAVVSTLDQANGAPAKAPATPSTPPVMNQVSYGDSLALSRLSQILGGMGKDFQVRYTQDSTLDDLKEGPVVLIGGFSNSWTMRLGSELRYNFEHDGTVHYISDRQNPGSRVWEAPDSAAATGPFTDYALLSRVLDATTGHVLITVAGIRHFGTQAAADCLADSSCVEAAEKLAPGDWRRANIQIVLAIPVIGERPGQPRVVAAHLW